MEGGGGGGGGGGEMRAVGRGVGGLQKSLGLPQLPEQMLRFSSSVSELSVNTCEKIQNSLAKLGAMMTTNSEQKKSSTAVPVLLGGDPYCVS